MTLGTWLVFGMAAFCFFHLGRLFQRKRDKELHKLAKDILEEAKKHDAAKRASSL